MYPVQLQTAHAAQRNRLTAFFRSVMAIPAGIFGALYGFASMVAIIIAWFALLVTGRYPQGIYDFVAGYIRVNARYSAYAMLLEDLYPPFSGGDEPGYPVRVHIAAPQAGYSRVKVFFRGLLMFPVEIVAFFYGVGMYLCAILSWFAIVFTGRQPEGLHSFMSGALNYLTQAAAYAALLTDAFPPLESQALTTGTAPAPA